MTSVHDSSLAQVGAAWLKMHVSVLLWGVTAILGRVITLDALPLVLWRMSLVALALLALPRVWRAMRRLPGRLLAAYAGAGVLLAAHWLTFYAAIKLANASVAVTCVATVPVLVSMLEPLLTAKRFDYRELLLGLLVLPGVGLVVGGTPGDMNIGIAVGLVSALFVALFAACSKRLVLRADSLCVTALEMGAGALFLALAGGVLLAVGAGEVTGFAGQGAAGVFALPAGSDLGYLLVLAFGCTLLPFALWLGALRHLSAYASSLVVNLEPVYAMVLAALLFEEQRELAWTFYAGAGLILATVFAYPLLRRWQRKAGNAGS